MRKPQQQSNGFVFGDKQRTLVTWWSKKSPYCDKDGIIAEGAVRSGKTYAMIYGFLLWSQKRFSDQNFILAGRSAGALKRNVVKPMLKVLRSLTWLYKYNRSENYIQVGTNIYYCFGASQERSQDAIQGITAAGCLLDEVALMPASFVNQAMARCSVEGAKFWFNCNPSYPTHFFKTDFIDKCNELNLVHLQFVMDDNPSLSDAVKERYRRMFVGVFYERYILGLWTLAEGLIYPDFRTALEPTWKPRKDKDGKDLPPERYAVSIDYGTQNAFAALLWVKDQHVWHVVKEYRYSGRDTGHQKTDPDYVADMREFLGDCPCDTPFIIDPSATSFHAIMRRVGFKVMKARNAVDDGIREANTCIKQGLVRISEDTPELQKEFAGYVWDDKAGCDKPVKENDHLMDAFRYGVATLRIYRQPQSDYVSPFRR